MADKMADSRLGEHMSNIKDEAVAAVGDLAGSARHTANRYVKSAKDIAEQGYDMAIEKGMQVKKTTQSYIKSKPFQAVGIALGVGFVVGFLLRRSNRA